jgi:hypothetical protein
MCHRSFAPCEQQLIKSQQRKARSKQSTKHSVCIHHFICIATMNFISASRNRGYVDLSASKLPAQDSSANAMSLKTIAKENSSSSSSNVDKDNKETRERRRKAGLKSIMSWQPSLPVSSPFGKRATRDILATALDDTRLLDDDLDESDHSLWNENVLAKGEKRKRLVLKSAKTNSMRSSAKTV